jgi:hypothetical protein
MAVGVRCRPFPGEAICSQARADTDSLGEFEVWVASSSAVWGWLDASELTIPKAFGLEAAARTLRYGTKTQT